MPEPWKSIICDDPACFFESVDEKGIVREEFRIFPEMVPSLTAIIGHLVLLRKCPFGIRGLFFCLRSLYICLYSLVLPELPMTY